MAYGAGAIGLTLWLPARKAAVDRGAGGGLGYALLAGFAVPAQRTVYMLAVVAIALWLGRFTSATCGIGMGIAGGSSARSWRYFRLVSGCRSAQSRLIMLISAGRIGKTWLSGWARVQWAITLGLIPLIIGDVSAGIAGFAHCQCNSDSAGEPGGGSLNTAGTFPPLELHVAARSLGIERLHGDNAAG